MKGIGEDSVLDVDKKWKPYVCSATVHIAVRLQFWVVFPPQGMLKSVMETEDFNAGSVESDKFLFFWKLLFLNMINSPKLLNNTLIIIFLTSWPHERDYSLLTAMQRNMTYEMLIFVGADKSHVGFLMWEIKLKESLFAKWK